MQKTESTRVALLGCGTVGREVARKLRASGPNMGLELVGVLVRDRAKTRTGIAPELITDRFDDILRAKPEIIIELIGGLEPAGTFVERALAEGIKIVTANKTLIARRADRICLKTQDSGFRTTNSPVLAYEAAVGAGIPIIATLCALAGDRITSIRAIVNGTCNYVLTRMSAGLSFEQALNEAQARGFAEPDPTADITGRDSAEKLCILAREAGAGAIQPADIPTQGIELVTPEDFRLAAGSGKTIKLIAEFARTPNGGIRVSVGPALVGFRNPLARIGGEDNAFVITAENAGTITLAGKGAGPGPTCTGVLGDVLRLASRQEASGHNDRAFVCQMPHARARRIRLRAADLSPARTFEAMRSLNMRADDVLFTRTGLCLDARATEGESTALCTALAAEPGSLIAPIISGPQ